MQSQTSRAVQALSGKNADDEHGTSSQFLRARPVDGYELLSESLRTSRFLPSTRVYSASAATCAVCSARTSWCSDATLRAFALSPPKTCARAGHAQHREAPSCLSCASRRPLHSRLRHPARRSAGAGMHHQLTCTTAEIATAWPAGYMADRDAGCTAAETPIRPPLVLHTLNTMSASCMPRHCWASALYQQGIPGVSSQGRRTR